MYLVYGIVIAHVAGWEPYNLRDLQQDMVAR